MGADPGGAPLGPYAPLWVDRWPGGESHETIIQLSTRENAKT